jgi:hypothetical protein
MGNMIIARSSSKFDYSFHTPEGLTLGSLTLPTYPAFPRKGLLGNSAPQRLAHHVSIRLGERPYHVEYALLTDRAFRGNDRQYFLMQGGQTILSTVASVVRSAPWDLSLDGKAYVLQKQGGLFAPVGQIAR